MLNWLNKVHCLVKFIKLFVIVSIDFCTINNFDQTNIIWEFCDEITIYFLSTLSKSQKLHWYKVAQHLVAYFEKIEHVINEIDFLTFYIKNNLKSNDFNVVAQSTLIVKVINDERNVNAHAKSTIIIASNFSNNCQSNDECVAQNKSIILNYNSIF